MRLSIFTLLIFTTISLSYSQNKHLNLGVKNSGICFGNSSYQNGLRLNIWDDNVKKINGVNLSIRSYSKIFNGISIGFLADATDITNGFSFGTIGIAGIKTKWSWNWRNKC